MEALSADTLTPVWVSADYQTKEDGEAHQSLSSLLYQDGKLYGATAAADWTSSYDGVVFCLDAQTGETVWTYTPGGTGYYWAGAAMVNGAIDVYKRQAFSRQPGRGSGQLSQLAWVRECAPAACRRRGELNKAVLFSAGVCKSGGLSDAALPRPVCRENAEKDPFCKSR